MNQNKNQKILFAKTQIIYGFAMSKFFLTSGFKWVDPKEFYLNKFISNSSKGCVLEVHLEYRNYENYTMICFYL